MEDNLNKKINEKELNSFITFFLVLVSIGSIIKSITSGISNSLWLDEGSEYVAFIPTIITIINAFLIIYFIVLKKDIVGVWLFFAMLAVQFTVFVYNGTSPEYAFIFVLTRAAFLSLILLFRKNGEFAWKTLMRNETSVEKDPTQESDSNKFTSTEFNNQYSGSILDTYRESKAPIKKDETLNIDLSNETSVELNNQELNPTSETLKRNRTSEKREVNQITELLKKDLDKILKLVLILFLIWIGYCAYNFSKNGRYANSKDIYGIPRILDTRTGNVYIWNEYDGEIAKDISK